MSLTAFLMNLLFLPPRNHFFPAGRPSWPVRLHQSPAIAIFFDPPRENKGISSSLQIDLQPASPEHSRNRKHFRGL